jgi:hypothetical protein
MPNEGVTLQQVEDFINNKLKTELREDILHHKMLREGDLECSTYYHLRKLLKPDRRWRLFARKYVKAIRRYPDLLVLKDQKPQIAIELKWRREKIASKDRNTLGKCLSKLGVHKVYFITTVIEKSDYKKLRWKKEPEEKYRLKEIVVRLSLRGRQKQKWEAQHEEYKAVFR